MNYYLSLGSNIGDRKANLDEAVSFLRTIGTIIKISSIYETAPVDMAPGSRDFYNLVVLLQCELSPSALLKKIKEFEKSKGRDMARSHKQPRVIDIDIVLAGDLLIDEDDLIIPHKEMHNRAFVLVPLAEIAPELLHPALKKSVNRMLQDLGSPVLHAVGA